MESSNPKKNHCIPCFFLFHFSSFDVMEWVKSRTYMSIKRNWLFTPFWDVIQSKIALKSYLRLKLGSLLQNSTLGLTGYIIK